jgi:hypothetical protein
MTMGHISLALTGYKKSQMSRDFAGFLKFSFLSFISSFLGESRNKTVKGGKEAQENESLATGMTEPGLICGRRFWPL